MRNYLSNSLQLLGVKELPGGRNGSIDLLILVQAPGIRNHGQPPLLVGGDAHLHQTGKRAPDRIHHTITRVPDDEGHNRKAHEHGGDPEAPPPPDVVLDIH